MKRLHILVIKSFLGPFVMTFFIVMFLLLMQFLWRYIDELVGKGLTFGIVAELMLYASASLVPLALPLSVLLSSLMTFGGMGEHYELTALKSSGISLRRIMMPVIILSLFISAGAFIFANNILPVTNLKMKSLLYDVRQQRPEVQITEGIFYNGIDNYSIRIGRKDPVTNRLYDIMIYDHSSRRGNTSVTIADSGHMQMTDDRRNLIVTLWEGNIYTELEDARRSADNSYPSRTDIFREQRIVIEMTGFELMRSDESIFKNSYQMLNVSQLGHITDSLSGDLERKTFNFNEVLLTNNYFSLKSDGNSSLSVVQSALSEQNLSPREFAARQGYLITGNSYSSNQNDTVEYIVRPAGNIRELLFSFSESDRYMILEQARSNASFSMNYVLSTSETINYDRKYLRRHEIEWHRKFTLSFACLIFLFVGAPLGAIIRKGGLGMPTVISTIFFVIYYILSLSGEKFVRESVMSGFSGMWLSSFILVVAGIFLTYEATNDSAILNLDNYLTWIRTRLGLKKSSLIEAKANIAGKFDYIDIDKSEVQDNFRYLTKQVLYCSEKLSEDASLKSIFNSIMENKSYGYLIELGIDYNGIFHGLMLSNWYRIPYFQKRLQEFPVLHYKTNSRLFCSKTFRKLSVVIFPVFIIRLAHYLISIRRLKRELSLIASLSNGMINLLDRAIIKSYFQTV